MLIINFLIENLPWRLDLFVIVKTEILGEILKSCHRYFGQRLIDGVVALPASTELLGDRGNLLNHKTSDPLDRHKHKVEVHVDNEGLFFGDDVPGHPLEESLKIGVRDINLLGQLGRRFVLEISVLPI